MPRRKSVSESEFLDPTTQSSAPSETEPKKRRTSKPAPATAVEVDDDLPVAVFRSRSSEPDAAPAVADELPAVELRSRRRKPAPAADEPPVVAESAPLVGEIFGGEDDDLPVAVFRTSTGEKPPREPREPRQKKQEAPRAEKVAAEPAVVLETMEIEDDEISFSLSFRTKSDEAPAAPRQNKERRERSERERKSVAQDVEAEGEVPPVVEPDPPAPISKVRPIVDIPEHAPQIVLRNELPTLVRNKRVYPPILFAAGGIQDSLRKGNVLEQIRMASEAGIHLFSLSLELEVEADGAATAIKAAETAVREVTKVDPHAQVLFRLDIQAPGDWRSKYKGSQSPGRQEPSICDDEFWEDAENSLRTFIHGILATDLAPNLLGIHLNWDRWQPSLTQYDNSSSAVTHFQAWLRHRYSNDVVALRANWFDGRVNFDTATIPEFGKQAAAGDRFIRASRKERRYVDLHLFISDAAVQRIGDLAYTVRDASGGEFLCGVDYGYTFECDHPASGQLSLGKLLRNPDIDFLAGPTSYRERNPGDTAPFPVPIDSLALNGKLFLSLEDFKTSLSGIPEPDADNPTIKTPQALESVQWRGAGAALAHEAGLSWTDRHGSGWLKTSTIWERAGRVQNSMVLRMASDSAPRDVCVFIDERALAYQSDDQAFRLLVRETREAVLRAGVNAGFYLLSDLAHRQHFPDAKLYIFLNAWDIRSELRAAIKSRLQRDNKVLFWLYAAGQFDGGRDSLERAREVTGIALRPQPFHSKSGTTILHRRHAVAEAFPTNQITGIRQLEPSYFAIPEDSLVIGEYSQTGLPSFVVKQFDGKGEEDGGAWTSVFLGEPHVNPALVRALAQMAGAHVYDFHEDVVHVRPPFLTLHAAGGGPRTITLPTKWTAYNLLQGGFVGMDSTNLRFHAADGSTHLFLIGPREDIEQLISTRPEDLLRMDTLPARDRNEREDVGMFDVPVMRLDEILEGGDTDEIADEWFLRPHAIAETMASEPRESSDGDESRVGRRRRRRRRSGGERDNSPPSSSDGMSVLFRRRD